MSDSMYVASIPRIPGEYKTGIHTGGLKKLRSRYGTYIHDVSIHYLIENINAAVIEEKFKMLHLKSRIPLLHSTRKVPKKKDPKKDPKKNSKKKSKKNSKSAAGLSEWFTLPLDRIIDDLRRIIMENECGLNGQVTGFEERNDKGTTILTPKFSNLENKEVPPVVRKRTAPVTEETPPVDEKKVAPVIEPIEKKVVPVIKKVVPVIKKVAPVTKKVVPDLVDWIAYANWWKKLLLSKANLTKKNHPRPIVPVIDSTEEGACIVIDLTEEETCPVPDLTEEETCPVLDLTEEETCPVPDLTEEETCPVLNLTEEETSPRKRPHQRRRPHK